MNNPKVLVLGANRGRWKASDKEEYRNHTTGIEAWVYAFDGEYCYTPDMTASELKNYDIIIGNTELPYLDTMLKLVGSCPKHTQWVTLIEGSATDYLTPMPVIRDILDQSDLVNCINKYSLEFLKLMTTSRVEYIGIPYPVDGLLSRRVDIKDRQKEIFITPALLNRWNDYFVARSIGIKYFGMETKIHRKLRLLPEIYKKYGTFDSTARLKKAASLYNDEQLEIRRALSLGDYFGAVAQSYMWINLDDRYTWGRYILDAATLGMPIISTKSTGHADRLFPDLCLDNEFEVDKAIELGKRLVEDQAFYKHVVTYPLDKMDIYKPEYMKNQLLQILNTI